jgi:RNA polymerase sigma-70 factor (ECF subfamily)
LSDNTEQELVARCRSGDVSAYTGLVKAYSGRVFAVCLAMTGNSHDAEDIAQQALMKGFVQIRHLRYDESFGAWIIQITKNLCVDFMRRQQRIRSLNAKLSKEEPFSSGGYRELRIALANLNEDYRLPLLLFYFNGRSTKNIAEALNISQAAVQTRLSRARKELRKLLEKEAGA